MFILEKNVKTAGQNYIVVVDVVQIVTIQQEALIMYMILDANYLEKESNVQ